MNLDEALIVVRQRRRYAHQADAKVPAPFELACVATCFRKQVLALRFEGTIAPML